jgi:hypothetical protein
MTKDVGPWRTALRGGNADGSGQIEQIRTPGDDGAIPFDPEDDPVALFDRERFPDCSGDRHLTFRGDARGYLHGGLLTSIDE